MKYTHESEELNTLLEERFSRLTIDEAVKYAGGENREICGWHISNLKIYDKPKDLSCFYKPCPQKNVICRDCEYLFRIDGSCMNIVTRPPQSYMRVEEWGE